jgi:hypothetical protein
MPFAFPILVTGVVGLDLTREMLPLAVEKTAMATVALLVGEKA